jgi:hypothetical protein
MESAPQIEHIWGLHSLGCGGVERAVSDWLFEMPENIRCATAIVSARSVAQTIPWPEDVHLGIGMSLLPIVKRHQRTLKSVFVAPLQCQDSASLIGLCRNAGVPIYWILCSTLPTVITDCKAAAKAGAVLLATSPALLQVARSIGVAEYLPHFVTEIPQRKGKRGKTLGYVGRLSPEKGHQRFPALLQAMPEYRLKICAPESSTPKGAQERLWLEKAFANAGVADRVTWTIDELDRSKLYDGIDTLLLLSEGEGYSLVAHEALSAGITVVASQTLHLCQEGNPGVLGCDIDTGIPAAIAAAGKPTFAAIAKASVGHGRDAWVAEWKDTAIMIMSGGAAEPRPFDRRWHGPERWAALASIPSRVELLRKTVASLLPQVDRLHVALNGYESVPEFLADPRIAVLRSQDVGDFGDAGKFLWADRCGGYYITCDDDIIYPPGYADRLVDAIEDRGRMAVVGFHGNILPNQFLSYYSDRVNLRFAAELPEDRPVDILGTGVCGFHCSTLPLSMADFPAPNMADIWLAKKARLSGVPLVCLSHSAEWIRPQPVKEGIYEAHKRSPDMQDTILRGMGGFGQPQDVGCALPGSLATANPRALSTIISAYQPDPEWLRLAIESAQAQPLPEGWHHEIWVGFDGCEPIPLPTGVHYAASKFNHGPYVMANLLAALSSGEYIGRVDADDAVRPNRAIRLISMCPPGGIAGSGYTDLEHPDSQTEHGARPCEGAWLFSRSALTKLGGWAAWRCAADTDSLERARLLGIPRASELAKTYLYRQHRQQLTRAAGTSFGSAIRQYYRSRIRARHERTVVPYIPARYTVHY